MSDNIVLEMLRAIRSDIGHIDGELKEHGRRLTRIELSLAAMRRDQANDAEARADMEARFDRLRERVDRIERRLDIAPA
jgi:septal ring factor EnvC (AmiA/AmiB activator)